MGGDDPDGFLHADSNSGTVNGVPRLGVPPLHLNDGPGGIRLGIGTDSAEATALPSPLALAAAFDPKLADLYAGRDRRRGQAPRSGHGARTDGEPRARPARGPQLRELRRGPAPPERSRRGLHPRPPAARGDRRREALRGQQPGEGPLHDRRADRRAHAPGDLPAAVRGGGQAGARGLGDDRLQQGERRVHGGQPAARPRHPDPRVRLQGPRALRLLRRGRHRGLGARRPEPRPTRAALLRARTAARGAGRRDADAGGGGRPGAPLPAHAVPLRGVRPGGSSLLGAAAGKAPRAEGARRGGPRRGAAPQPPIAPSPEPPQAALGGRDREAGGRVPAPQRHARAAV